MFLYESIIIIIFPFVPYNFLSIVSMHDLFCDKSEKYYVGT